MNVQAPINLTSLFSANGLVVVITGGGSGMLTWWFSPHFTPRYILIPLTISQ